MSEDAKEVPPHTHDPSDIIETEDDKLLPYWRSKERPELIDPLITDRLATEAPQIPIYDPRPFSHTLYAPGVSGYIEAVVFKLPVDQACSRRLQKIAVQAYCENGGDKARLKIWVRYSVNEGSDWSDYGDIITVTHGAPFQEETIEVDVESDINEPLWVQFRYQVELDSGGPSSVTGVIDDCELRTHSLKMWRQRL